MPGRNPQILLVPFLTFPGISFLHFDKKFSHFEVLRHAFLWYFHLFEITPLWMTGLQPAVEVENLCLQFQSGRYQQRCHVASDPDKSSSHGWTKMSEYMFFLTFHVSRYTWEVHHVSFLAQHRYVSTVYRSIAFTSRKPSNLQNLFVNLQSHPGPLTKSK